MPHHSTVLSPLHSLLKKYIPWMWSKIEEDALLLDSQTLVYYDHTLSLFVMLHLTVEELFYLTRLVGNFDPLPLLLLL